MRQNFLFASLVWAAACGGCSSTVVNTPATPGGPADAAAAESPVPPPSQALVTNAPLEPKSSAGDNAGGMQMGRP